jgi:PIN domain nuclease of toxin-antitoxin system
VIVLDSHAWVWWLTKPEKLGRKALRSLEKASHIGLPAICVWEIAMKAHLGRLKFDRPYDLWTDEALACDPRLEVLPLAPRISLASVKLSWAHSDPADRIIVATAQAYEAPLLTADQTIQESGLVRCVWD